MRAGDTGGGVRAAEGTAEAVASDIAACAAGGEGGYDSLNTQFPLERITGSATIRIPYPFCFVHC